MNNFGQSLFGDVTNGTLKLLMHIKPEYVISRFIKNCLYFGMDMR